ncbi:hypothetical protein ABPG74_018914 [Tetrahymena malaccensis]
MRFFAIALLALIAIASVSAQSQADIDKLKSIAECMQKIKEPCQTSDKDCQAEQEKLEDCQDKCKKDNSNSMSDAFSCAKKCSSTNKDVQAWYDAQIACVSSSIISFAFAALISAFALLF